MTFDFTPGWLDSLIQTAEKSMPVPRAAATGSAAPCAPVHPTPAQVAGLVEELFTEGSLSFEQLCSLSNVPELESLLGATVAGVPQARRTVGRR